MRDNVGKPAQLVPILDSILFYANEKNCAIYLKILLTGVCLSGEVTPSHLYQDKHTPGSQIDFFM